MKKPHLLVLAGILIMALAPAVFAQDYQFYSQYDVPNSNSDYYSSYSDPYSYSSYYSPYGYGKGNTLYSSRPRFSSNYASSESYRESPGYTQGPKASMISKQSSSSFASNQDSSAYSYDYRGPLYEKKFTQIDDFSHDLSSKSGFFNSRSNNLLRHVVSTSMTEKYVGASESLYSSTQNRQFASNNANAESSQAYDGGFSFGKQRSYDASEYSAESYKEPYYYRPYFDNSAGYYNWNY